MPSAKKVNLENGLDVDLKSAGRGSWIGRTGEREEEYFAGNTGALKNWEENITAVQQVADNAANIQIGLLGRGPYTEKR